MFGYVKKSALIGLKKRVSELVEDNYNLKRALSIAVKMNVEVGISQDSEIEKLKMERDSLALELILQKRDYSKLLSDAIEIKEELLNDKRK